MTEHGLTLALSKGRIFKETLPLLARVGIHPKDDPETSRKLILDTNIDALKLVIIRAQDVPTYVAHGAADLGVAGKDVLTEHGGDGLYECLDLGIARCRMMVAGPIGWKMPTGRVKVATKYTQTAKRYFASKGLQSETVKLYGSMELAPLVGLADCIVDLVDTGKTLSANGLEAIEHMDDISSRLVVNKTAMKIKSEAVLPFIRQLSDVLSS